MNTITLINGNGQVMHKNLPKIKILADEINRIALDHITENTGLVFEKREWGYIAQPTQVNQYIRLLLTYNFKTRYYDNATYSNTLMLRFDHHVGFDVQSICLDCAKHNHIHTGDMQKDSRLSC